MATSHLPPLILHQQPVLCAPCPAASTAAIAQVSRMYIDEVSDDIVVFTGACEAAFYHVSLQYRSSTNVLPATALATSGNVQVQSEGLVTILNAKRTDQQQRQQKQSLQAAKRCPTPFLVTVSRNHPVQPHRRPQLPPPQSTSRVVFYTVAASFDTTRVLLFCCPAITVKSNSIIGGGGGAAPASVPPLTAVATYQCAPRNLRFREECYPIHCFYWQATQQKLLCASSISVDLVTVDRSSATLKTIPCATAPQARNAHFPAGQASANTTTEVVLTGVAARLLHRCVTRVDAWAYDRLTCTLLVLNKERSRVVKSFRITADDTVAPLCELMLPVPCALTVEEDRARTTLRSAQSCMHASPLSTEVGIITVYEKQYFYHVQSEDAVILLYQYHYRFPNGSSSTSATTTTTTSGDGYTRFAALDLSHLDSFRIYAQQRQTLQVHDSSSSTKATLPPSSPPPLHLVIQCIDNLIIVHSSLDRQSSIFDLAALPSQASRQHRGALAEAEVTYVVGPRCVRVPATLGACAPAAARAMGGMSVGTDRYTGRGESVRGVDVLRGTDGGCGSNSSLPLRRAVSAPQGLLSDSFVSGGTVGMLNQSMYERQRHTHRTLWTPLQEKRNSSTATPSFYTLRASLFSKGGPATGDLCNGFAEGAAAGAAPMQSSAPSSSSWIARLAGASGAASSMIGASTARYDAAAAAITGSGRREVTLILYEPLHTCRLTVCEVGAAAAAAVSESRHRVGFERTDDNDDDGLTRGDTLASEADIYACYTLVPSGGSRVAAAAAATSATPLVAFAFHHASRAVHLVQVCPHALTHAHPASSSSILLFGQEEEEDRRHNRNNGDGDDCKDGFTAVGDAGEEAAFYLRRSLCCGGFVLHEMLRHLLPSGANTDHTSRNTDQRVHSYLCGSHHKRCSGSKYQAAVHVLEAIAAQPCHSNSGGAYGAPTLPFPGGVSPNLSAVHTNTPCTVPSYTVINVERRPPPLLDRCEVLRALMFPFPACSAEEWWGQRDNNSDENGDVVLLGHDQHRQSRQQQQQGEVYVCATAKGLYTQEMLATALFAPTVKEIIEALTQVDSRSDRGHLRCAMKNTMEAEKDGSASILAEPMPKEGMIIESRYRFVTGVMIEYMQRIRLCGTAASIARQLQSVLLDCLLFPFYRATTAAAAAVREMGSSEEDTLQHFSPTDAPLLDVLREQLVLGTLTASRRNAKRFIDAAIVVARIKDRAEPASELLTPCASTLFDFGMRMFAQLGLTRLRIQAWMQLRQPLSAARELAAIHEGAPATAATSREEWGRVGGMTVHERRDLCVTVLQCAADQLDTAEIALSRAAQASSRAERELGEMSPQVERSTIKALRWHAEKQRAVYITAHQLLSQDLPASFPPPPSLTTS